ncbi:hypothetical protein JOF34_001943 [Microbacterium amylolyticum]|uniref:Uncharacterized protein n=1 Tax=Microbacterium amylolyticum TaxID=936337 RepID=A0ABS4ZJI2_9MICO|nr:hypothetical protein [Microbacterium amylolyticum]
MTWDSRRGLAQLSLDRKGLRGLLDDLGVSYMSQAEYDAR